VYAFLILQWTPDQRIRPVKYIFPDTRFLCYLADSTNLQGGTDMAQDKLTVRAQEMHTHIRKYFSSGLTQKQFCDQEKLPLSTFQYWLYHLRRHNKPKSQTTTPGFIPLQLKDHSRDGFSCHVCYPNGVSIDFDGAIDAHFLLTLIKIESS